METFLNWWGSLDPGEQLGLVGTLTGLNFLSVAGGIQNWLGWRHAGEKLKDEINANKKLKEEVKDAEDAMRRFQPAEWLRRADEATRSGDIDGAARSLRIGYENIATDLGIVLRRLAEYHADRSGLRENEFDEAYALARMSTLMNPKDQEARALADELHEAAATPDVSATRFDSDIKWMESLDAGNRETAKQHIRVLLDRCEIHHQQGRDLLMLRLAAFAKRVARESGLTGTSWEFDARRVLVGALLARGQPQAAKNELDDFESAQERARGPDHIAVIRTHMTRANVLTALNEHEQALARIERALVLIEGKLGQRDPDVLMLRYKRANILDHLGRDEEALAELNSYAPLQKEVHGAEHPWVLMTRSLMGRVLDNVGRHEDALREFDALAEIDERVLGPEHPSTLVNYYLKARALTRQGQPEEALQMIDGYAACQARVLGPDHPHVMATSYLRARALRAAGRTQEALAEANELVAVATRALGVDHPDTLIYAEFQNELVPGGNPESG